MLFDRSIWANTAQLTLFALKESVPFSTKDIFRPEIANYIRPNKQTACSFAVTSVATDVTE